MKEETVLTGKHCQIASAIIAGIGLFLIFICFACNVAIANAITWAWYPIGGIALVLLITLPALLLRSHRALISLIAGGIGGVAYLFLIRSLLPDSDWVIRFALPIYGVSFVFIAIILALHVYTRINPWFIDCLACILFAIADVFINFMVQESFQITADSSIIVIPISFLAVAVFLFILGIVLPNSRKPISDVLEEQEEAENDFDYGDYLPDDN